MPEKGPYIIAANHVDFLDGFCVTAALDMTKKHIVYFLAKTKNYWWAQATLPVDPKNKSQSIKDAVRYLGEGKIICSFIEGYRNTDKHLPRGKTGSARMALMAQVPVVPLGIIGQQEKKFGRSIKKMLTSNNHVIINIGEPITFEQYYNQEITKDLLEKLTHEIMGQLAPLCGKAYSF